MGPLTPRGAEGVEFQDWPALREQPAATFGPLHEEDSRLALFSLFQTGSLDEYVRAFSRLSLFQYLFPTSMNFRERCCLFEVFRVNFDPMLCVNIQKTCLRQLGQQEQLAGARISRLGA